MLLNLFNFLSVDGSMLNGQDYVGISFFAIMMAKKEIPT